jgi:hypothetical protein
MQQLLVAYIEFYYNFTTNAESMAAIDQPRREDEGFWGDSQYLSEKG